MDRLAAFLLCVCVLALCLPAAEAQETPEYKDAISLGVSEFDEKNFFEARAQFARAHAIYPNARTSRALGMVAFELKDYVQSVRYLKEALASQERNLDPDMRAQAQVLFKRALGYVGRFRLDIESGTAVRVDGRPTDVRAEGELMLSVGEHVLEFSAAERITDKRTLSVQGGEESVVRVRLQRATNEAAVAGERSPGQRPVYKNPWLWTAIGVVVVGAAAGTAVVLMRDPGKRTEEPYAGTGGIAPLMGVSLP